MTATPAFVMKIFRRLYDSERFRDDDEAYISLLLSAMTLFAAFVHLVHSLFFVFTGLPPLAIINGAGMCLSALAFLLVRLRHYTAAGLLISLEITTIVVLSSLLIGFDHYLILYYFIVLFVQLDIPYGSRLPRAAIAAGLFVLLLAQAQIETGYAAPLSMGQAQGIFAVINIFISFLSITFVLLISAYLQNTLAQIKSEYARRLETEAHTDPLTGMYNRRYADLYFERLKVTHADEMLCVAMVDIDDFKQINDTYGHARGDVALVQLAAFFRDALRKSDAIFRWGGEEFLIVMTGVGLDQAAKLLDRLRLRLSASEEIRAAAGFNFTVTIGVANLQLTDIPASIASCDSRLYCGKRANKNQVVCA
jgi:diguanylate cyclase (GGDEF)-like protein